MALIHKKPQIEVPIASTLIIAKVGDTYHIKDEVKLIMYINDYSLQNHCLFFVYFHTG